MKTISTFIFLFSCLIFIQPVYSDIFSPSHSCYKPSKPFEFTEQWEVDNFRMEVENFKNCINDFIEEQEGAIRKHKQAAEDAIDDWNNFVMYELS